MDKENQLLWQDALQQQVLSMAVNLAASLGVVLIAYNCDPQLLPYWLASAVLVTLLRAVVFVQLKRIVHTPQASRLKLYQYLLQAGLILASLHWSVLSWRAIASYGKEDFYIILMTIAAMTGGAASTQAALRIGKVYIVLLLLPTAIQLARQSTLNEHILSVMTLIYAAAMLVSHHKNHGFLRTFIRHSLENEKLLDALSHKSDELKASNRDLEFKVMERTAELSLQAHRDHLTQALNRRGLLSNDEDIKRQFLGGWMTLLFVDLDHFKEINDSLGHAYGDLLLQRVAHNITQCIAQLSQEHPIQRSLVSRWGGDEFALVLLSRHEPTPSTLDAWGRHLLLAIATPLEVSFRTVEVSACIGIASQQIQANNGIEQLLDDADIAAGHAKQQGRKQHRIYQPPMREHMTRLQKLSDALSKSQLDDSLHLEYQPIVCAWQADPPLAYEALLRWNHADVGRVHTQDLVSVAEASNVMKDMGLWVLERCTQALIDHPHAPRIAINISTQQLNDAQFAEQIIHLLQSKGLPHSRLVLEISENAIGLHTNPQIKKTIESLARAGVELHLNEFGAGSTALSHLHQLPIRAVKLDKSFLDNWTPQAAAIVEGTTLMLKRLGMLVIAMGVETAEQAEQLRQLGIDGLQGYWVGRPGPLPPPVTAAPAPTSNSAITP